MIGFDPNAGRVSTNAWMQHLVEAEQECYVLFLKNLESNTQQSDRRQAMNTLFFCYQLYIMINVYEGVKNSYWFFIVTSITLKIELLNIAFQGECKHDKIIMLKTGMDIT